MAEQALHSLCLQLNVLHAWPVCVLGGQCSGTLHLLLQRVSNAACVLPLLLPLLLLLLLLPAHPQPLCTLQQRTLGC